MLVGSAEFLSFPRDDEPGGCRSSDVGDAGREAVALDPVAPVDASDDGARRLSVSITPLLTTAALARTLEQDLEERTWPNPRDARPAETPWPPQDDPVVLFLAHRAVAAIAAGADLIDEIRALAVRAWFEGGVRAYDQGQRDARRPRST